jgi:adenylyltransferase/sulfurtransferase
VLGVLPGVVGTLEAIEAIKLLLGLGRPLLGRLLVYDALDQRFVELALERRADCVCCSRPPHEIELADAAAVCAAPAATG